MATVYRARDTRLDVLRAIKVLSPAMTMSGPIRERFESEARMLANLRHPNIVSVLDVGEDQRKVFMVMELVDGGTLDRVLKARGVLRPGEALWILDGILAALDLAHAQGVIHRDIKPENILLTRYGTPKLADFGIARQQDVERNLTRTGSVLGTWAFMAPEQRTDAKSVDVRADLYAVAATLFNLITGRDPFDLYSAEIQDQLFEGMPPRLRAFIVQATRYKPADRFASANEMREAMRALGDEYPYTSPEIPELEALPPPPPPVAAPSTADLSSVEVPPVEGLKPQRSGLTDPGEERSFPRWLGILAILAMVLGLTGYWRWQNPVVPGGPPKVQRMLPPPPKPEPPAEAPPEEAAAVEAPPVEEPATASGGSTKPRTKKEENPWGKISTTTATTPSSTPAPQPMSEPAGDAARIVVQSKPSGAEVFVNRVSVGRTPYTATVTARRNRITLVGAGGEEYSYSISTSAGDIESVCYDFERDADCR